MTREEKEQTGKYVLQIARLLEDGCYQQEMLLKAVHIIDEALEQEPTAKNDLAVDYISRQGTIDAIRRIHPIDTDYDCTLLDKDNVMYVLNDMPSVTPQEPKTGHWILSHIPESILDECSECGFSCGAFTFNYCPNCGAKMVELQENEG